MPRSRRSSSESSGRGEGEQRPESEMGGNGAGGQEIITPGTTGRYLVLMREDAMDAGIRALERTAGLSVARSADFEGGGVPGHVSGAEVIVFDELAVAVVDGPPEQLRAVRSLSAEDSGILAIEPERYVYAIQDEASLVSPATAEFGPQALQGGTMIPEAGPLVPPLTFQPTDGRREPRLPVEYLMGYRDAVNHLVDQVMAAAGVLPTTRIEAEMALAMLDESELTWGLQITKVAESSYSGRGVRVAVLDTGMDLEHPDFAGRQIVARSFIEGEEVQDGHGHGTHCIGTACGPKQPGQLPRYGIAYDAEIYAGKVLSNRGSGADGGILAGINWAIMNECRIISMSLGAPTVEGQAFSRVYEAVARRALARGTLIIAAAGNESQRPSLISPVGHPANCPSIMAVGALDPGLAVAFFSCGGLSLQGGQVDIAGPGVNVHSSWPRPLLYRTISGTSMATPHVAGIAALHAEANPDVRGGALGWLLLQSARRVDLPTRDVGAGIVQAP